MGGRVHIGGQTGFTRYLITEFGTKPSGATGYFAIRFGSKDATVKKSFDQLINTKKETENKIRRLFGDL